MQLYFSEFGILLLTHLMAMMIPGPDFIVVLRHSLAYSRAHGVVTAFGIGTGFIFHLSYTILGVGYLLAQHEALYQSVKYIGASYLLYMSLNMLRSSSDQKDLLPEANSDIKNAPNIFSCFKSGFLTNLLNPKCTIFFFGLYNTVVSISTPLMIQVGYGVAMLLSTYLWFSCVAFVFSQPKSLRIYQLYRRNMDRLFAAILTLVALKITVT